MLIVLALAALSLALVAIGLISGVRRAVPHSSGTPNEENVAASSRPATSDAGRTNKLAEMKRLIAAGEWRVVLPSLLVSAGLLGFMIFGALALIVGFEQRVTGALMLGVALYAAWKIFTDYRRS